MTGRLRWVVAAAFVSFAVFAMTASAHVYTEYGGGGDDTINGHEHTDFLYGNSGCDDLFGHDGEDHLEGGPSGCDQVRGMEGASDDVIVWDDSVGNDEAYGGAGGLDRCFVGNKDWYDKPTCEIVVTP